MPAADNSAAVEAIFLPVLLMVVVAAFALAVIASEAKQSISQLAETWIASSLRSSQ
jgi:fumarate reductase subunit D